MRAEMQKLKGGISNMKQMYGIAFAILLIGSVMAAGIASAQVDPDSVTRIGSPPKVIWYQKDISPTAAGSAKVSPVAVQAVKPYPGMFKVAAEARTQRINAASVAPVVVPIGLADDNTRDFCEADINQDGTVDTRDILAYLNGDKGEIDNFMDFLDMWKSQRGTSC